jgi:hypothetical protein
MKYNDRPTIEDAWRNEVERFEGEPEDWDTADAAELADELDLFRIEAAEDPRFWDTHSDWYLYLYDNGLWLALEQCCNEGVLLPIGQRELRVQTCPVETRDKLGYFLGHCPIHVLHHIALHNWALVRIERARRNGSADWRPETSEPRSSLHDTVFFRPQVLKFRNYAL